MTLVEKIADLDGKCRFVSDFKETTDKMDQSLISNETEAVRFFRIGLIVSAGNGRFTTAFEDVAVINYGESDEEVLPLLQEKADKDESDTFRDTVRKYLDNNYVSEERPFISIDSVNEECQFAICTSYEDSGTSVSRKTWIVGLYEGSPYIKEFVA